MNQAYAMEDRLEKELGYRPKLVYKVDAYRVIAAGNVAYKKAFENQVARLGKDHIAIQTQYLLNFVDSIGAFFSAEQLARMYNNSYKMRIGPKPGGIYLFSIDVAGQEEEVTTVDEGVNQDKRDSTDVIIGELQPDGVVVPVCFYHFTGEAHTTQRNTILSIIRHWGCIGGICDATGIGEPLAYFLIEQLPRLEIEAYKFKSAGDENKSKLGYLAYSFVKEGKIQLPNRPVNDAQQAELWDEAKYQLENLIRVAKKQQTINYYVPVNAKPRKPGHVPHDDIVMALFMLMKATINIKDPAKRKAIAGQIKLRG
jgi:hypothetical protein